MMNGKIGVISQEEKGSNFWFTFSAKKSKDEALKVNKEVIDYETLKLNLTVLLVEDTPVISKIISMMLLNANCKVDHAENGQEALEIFEQNKYDIILMDIQMPVLDGLTTIKILRERFEILPVIIGISANAIEGEADRFKKLGMDDYLTKPVSMEILCDKLLKWSNHKLSKQQYSQT